MSRTFIITLGTGNSDEDIINLARGFATFLNDFHPEKTIFVGSEKSEKTKELIETEIMKIYGETLSEPGFHTLTDIDDVQTIFEEISTIIEENKDSQIYINYTSGTKSMSVAAALSSVVYKTTLLSLTGDRNEYGVVDSQKSTYKRNNLYRVYDKLSTEKMKKYFNIYRFDQSQEMLSEIVDIKHKTTYEKTFKYYDKWDKFDHKMKLEDINTEDFDDEEFKKQLKNNQEAITKLKRLQDEDNDYYILADLINNSQRRYEEQKYDDAVARLYRAIELIAQTQLKKSHEINPAKIKVKTLKTRVSNEYYEELQKRSNKNGEIKLPLRKDYELLSELKDTLGNTFTENNELNEILTARNNSILAHGKKTISKEKYTKMKDNTIQLAKILNPNIEEYMQQCEFPKFKLD